MRQLTQQEVIDVSGGLVGTRIPFYNGFIPGANWPGGGSGTWAAVGVAFNTGWAIGQGVNWYNANVTGMSLGEAIYRTKESC